MARRINNPSVYARMFIPAALALFWLFCSPLQCLRGQAIPTPYADLTQLADQAKDAQRREDYRGAAAIYEQILTRQPHSPEASANLGLMYHHLGEYKAAVSTFETALHESPQLYIASLFMGLDLLSLHQPHKALPFLERACSLNKRDAQSQAGLGAAYLAVGNPEMARKAYERAALIDLKDPDAWYGLGVAYLDLQESAVDRLAESGKQSPYARDLVAHSMLQQGTPDAAVSIYRDLLKSRQSLPCLEADLGFAYIQTEDFQSAEQAFRYETRDRPGCLLARLGLARISLGQHKPDEALSELFGIWTLDQGFLKENLPILFIGLNDDPGALLKDSCARTLGTPQEIFFGHFLCAAIKALQDESYEPRSPLAIVSSEDSCKPGTPVESLHLAGRSPESLLSQGRYSECSRSLRARRRGLSGSDFKMLCECAYFSGDFRTSFWASGELAKYPSDIVPSQYWRAKSAEKLGVVALSQAGLVAPNSPRVHFLLGEFYREKYQEGQAEAEYRRVLELQPNDVAAHLGLADAYSISTDFDQATAELKRVFSLDPGQPDANYLMGNILVNRHHYLEALPYLQTALQGHTAKVPLVHGLISRVYASQGRTRDAISELLQALQADQDGSLHYQLSALYRKAGEPKAAAAALEKSRSISRQRNPNASQGTITEDAGSGFTPTSP